MSAAMRMEETPLSDSDDSKRYRYFVEFFGGRNNW